MRHKGPFGLSAFMLLIFGLLSLINAKLTAGSAGFEDPPIGKLVSDDSTTKKDSDSDEFIPVLPNPLRRLQANYETDTLGPGVSVINDCGCPGCCTLTPVTVTKTVELTSTNFCFFTTTTATTTEITIVTTQTTTSVTTKTSNLKIVETITKRTTSTILSVFYTTSTVSNSILRFNTRLQLATEKTLSVQTTASFIQGTVTRRIPYFTPYTIYQATTTSYFTEYLQTYRISTLRTTITNFGGGTVFGTLLTTQTVILTTSVNQNQVITTIVATVTRNITGYFPAVITTAPPKTTTFIDTVVLQSTNPIAVPYTATIVRFPSLPIIITETALSTKTFSLLTSFPP